MTSRKIGAAEVTGQPAMLVTMCPIAKPTPALAEPMIATCKPARTSESLVTRPFATPTRKSASSVHTRLTTSAVEREKKKYGQSGTMAATR